MAHASRPAVPRRLVAALASLAALATACLSPPEAPPTEAEPYAPAEPTPEATGGYLLAQFDKSLRRWTELKLSARDPGDQRVLRALEANLTERAKKARDELVLELETGPRINREVAAVALGFTEDPTVLSPLLAALSDESPSVVQKALLGVGILADPATPLAKIHYLALEAPDPWTRNNATYAMMCLVAAGARHEDLAPTARAALIDDEPGVRAQAASVLGMLHDPTAVEPLGDLLHDDTALVVRASARALVRIGLANDEHKGDVARSLVDALEQLEAPRRRIVLAELTQLSDRPHGNDLNAWREWAYRMP